ncbi:MAG: HlyC/CorC family transporter [Euryarchaeota archaeon]|nr:HlyC/CorC family transporter [Euryarchaeota archaeon]
MDGLLVLFEVSVLLVCLLLSAFFSCAETALISVNRLHIRKREEDGVGNAAIVARLLEHPDRLLATILVGNNIVNIGAASIATLLAIDLFGHKGVGIATGIVTFLVLVFGEITPKAVAFQNAERLSLLLARPVDFLVRILEPVVRLLTRITNLLIRPFGGEVRKISPFVTQEEIKMMMEVGEREGVIEREEKEMIEGVLDFRGTSVREVMVPRLDMRCIDVHVPLEIALKIVTKTNHSRTPVYDTTIDNIVGILYTKDLLRCMEEGGRKKINEIMRPAYHVPDTKRLDELFQEMRRKRVQIAMVVDEDGGTVGLVTMEDLLEEIVGEIADEYETGVGGRKIEVGVGRAS